MYDFTAALIAFFALAGVASACAVAVLVRIAVEQRALRSRMDAPFGADRQTTYRRAA